MERGFNKIFYNKKDSDISLKTILYILIAISAIILFGWALVEAANRIFK